MIVSLATHIKGGHIDQAWLRCKTNHYDVQLYSPYYTCKDHDALLFSLYEPSTEKGKYLLRITHLKNVFFKIMLKESSQRSQKLSKEQESQEVKFETFVFLLKSVLLSREKWACPTTCTDKKKV